MIRRNTHKRWWRQLGQSMAEYTVVMAALVGGLLVANRGACPDEYEDCIEYLLTVMHDNYDGYSSSISAVHKYDRDYALSDVGDDDDDDSPPGGGPGDGDSGGGPPGGVPDTPPVTQATVLQSADGSTTYGTIDAEGNVVLDGQVVGVYNQETGKYEQSDGTVIVGVTTEDVVVDEDGNVLEVSALVDCVTGASYGFGYQSQANGKFYDALQLEEVDTGAFCIAPAYPMILDDGTEDGGRIVNGYYYPTVYSSNLPSPVQPAGEVIYFEEYDACVVMAIGWDEGVLAEHDDDEDIYEGMIELWQETPEAENPALGTMDPSACDENRTISAP